MYVPMPSYICTYICGEEELRMTDTHIYTYGQVDWNERYCGDSLNLYVHTYIHTNTDARQEAQREGGQEWEREWLRRFAGRVSGEDKVRWWIKIEGELGPVHFMSNEVHTHT